MPFLIFFQNFKTATIIIHPVLYLL